MPRGPATRAGSVRLEGAPEMVRRLEEIERRVLNQGLKEGLTRAAEIVAADAASRAPIDTHALASNMRTEYVPQSRRAKVGPGWRTAWYGYWQEFGTSRMRAHSFLRPALIAKAGEVAGAIADGVRRAVAGR